MTEEHQLHYLRHRFPAEIIAHAVWLYYRFPLSFCEVEDLLAERGIEVSFQTISEWGAKFGLKFAYQLRRRSRGKFAAKWQLDEMVVSIKGKKYWLWRAVDANGYVLQSRRNKRAALRLMGKRLKAQGTAPRVMMARYRIVRHRLKTPPKRTQYVEDPLRRRHPANSSLANANVDRWAN